MGWSVIGGLLLILAAPVNNEGKPASALVGEWKCEAASLGGKPVLKAVGWTFEFTADGKLRTRKGPDAAVEEGTYAADQKADPAELDWTLQESGVTLAAIYRLNKDFLTLCVNDRPKGIRPARFESPEKSLNLLLTFRRIEKKKE